MNDIDNGGTLLEYALWLFGTVTVLALVTLIILYTWAYVVDAYLYLSERVYTMFARNINNTRR